MVKVDRALRVAIHAFRILPLINLNLTRALENNCVVCAEEMNSYRVQHILEDNLFCCCLYFYGLHSIYVHIYFKLFPKSTWCQIRFFLLLLFSSLGICQARKSRDPADDGGSPENAAHCRRERYISSPVGEEWTATDGQDWCSRCLIFTVCFGGGERTVCGVWGCLSVHFHVRIGFSPVNSSPQPSAN